MKGKLRGLRRSKTVTKLILIDGNAILHRAFHALPPSTDRRGNPINAVYGLVSMFLKVVADLDPTHIAVCFDVKAPTFRHKAFKEYQAQRPPTADELSGQFEKAKKVMRAFGIGVYEKSGYEADDLIGTFAKKASPMRTVVVTGDRDILQLVDERVSVYMPVSGLSSAKLMEPKGVEEKMGVEPSEITVYKSLVGDASDNYRGVAGIGPKTAISLIKEYKTLSNIYAHLKQIKPSVREKLIKGRGDAKMSLKLATIKDNVKVKFSLDDCGRWDIDSPQALKLFKEFGFKTLTQRIKKVGKEMDEKRQIKLL